MGIVIGAGRGVDIGNLNQGREGVFTRWNFFQRRARGGQWQRPSERRGQVVEIAIAAPSAVQPQDFAGRDCADNHMVKEAWSGQPFIQPVAAFRIHDRGLGLDSKFTQQGNQQHGLRLAVAETTLPCFVGSRRDIAATVERDENIADAVFHHLQGSLSALGWVRGTGRDRGRLRLDRRIRAQLGGFIEKWRQLARHILPRPEVRELDQPSDIIPRRCALSRDGARGISQREIQRGLAVRRLRLDRRHILARAPVELPVRRPSQTEAKGARSSYDRQLYEARDSAVEAGLPLFDGGGQSDLVTDLQARNLQGGGTHARQNRLFQLRLTLEDYEFG